MYLESSCWLFMMGLTSLIGKGLELQMKWMEKRAEAGVLGGSKAWAASLSYRTPSGAFQEGPRFLGVLLQQRLGRQVQMQTYLIRFLSSIWLSQLKEGKEVTAFFKWLTLLPSCCLLLKDSHWALCPCLSLAQVYCVWELDVAWWAGWPFMGWFNWRILIVSWCEGVLAQPTLSILRYVQEADDSYQVIEALSTLGKVETPAESYS